MLLQACLVKIKLYIFVSPLPPASLLPSPPPLPLLAYNVMQTVINGMVIPVFIRLYTQVVLGKGAFKFFSPSSPNLLVTTDKIIVDFSYKDYEIPQIVKVSPLRGCWNFWNAALYMYLWNQSCSNFNKTNISLKGFKVVIYTMVEIFALNWE